MSSTRFTVRPFPAKAVPDLADRPGKEKQMTGSSTKQAGAPRWSALQRWTLGVTSKAAFMGCGQGKGKTRHGMIPNGVSAGDCGSGPLTGVGDLPGWGACYLFLDLYGLILSGRRVVGAGDIDRADGVSAVQAAPFGAGAARVLHAAAG
jgi:hypothetical protein